jgi:hypothetical protein
MSADWKTLSNKTTSLRTLQTVYERNGTDVNRVLFAGLHVTLSEITGLLTATGAATVTIFADTFVVDAPALAASGIVVVARDIDVSALKGAALQVGRAGKASIAQFLAKGVTGGLLQVSASPGKDVFAIPAGDRPLRSGLYRVAAAGSATSEIRERKGDLEDLLGRIWALNSMKASFAAAAWLMTQSRPDRDLARSMLTWIVSAIGALGTERASDFGELYGKAASLLVELNIAPGAYYLPVLSADFYEKQVAELLTALQGYETNFAQLDAKTGLAEVVADVGKALQSVTGKEAAPLKTHLTNVENNVAGLKKDIQSLSRQVILQQIDTETSFTLMVATIKSEKIMDFVKGVFKVMISVVKAGVAFTKAERSIGDGLSALADAVMQGKAAIDAINAAMPENTFNTRSRELLEMQNQLMLAYAAGETLFLQTKDGEIETLPEKLAIEAVDPNLAWNNYIIESETEMTILKEDLGAESSSLESVNRYLLSLKILAQYGQALDSKFVACAAQMATVPMIRAQIRAAENAEARWKELSSKAETDEQRLAILKAAVQARIDTIKRAIFAAWRDFRNSYFYLYFKEPSANIDLDMNVVQMREVFTKLTADIAKIYVDPDATSKVALPADDVALEFEFAVVPSGQPYTGSAPMALFTPAGTGKEPMLTWMFQPGSNQFLDQLADAAELAIWVRQAEFFLEGMVANGAGNVMTKVSTSGTYQNGYGPGRTYSFVSRGLVGDYNYKAEGNRVYNPWKINTAVYATPTPFTQWQIAFVPNGGDPKGITKLRVELKLAYRRSPQAG